MLRRRFNHFAVNGQGHNNGIFMRHRDTEVHGPSGYPNADLLEVCDAAATRAPLSAVSPFERKADGDILDLGRFPVDALDLGAVERGLPKEFMLRSLQLNAEADGSITVEAIGLDARRRMWQAETDGGRTGA